MLNILHDTVNNMFVSLHIRSMWETIYDAQGGFCTVDLKQ